MLKLLKNMNKKFKKYIYYFSGLIFIGILILGYFSFDFLKNQIKVNRFSLDFQKEKIKDLELTVKQLEEINKEDLVKLEESLLEEKKKRISSEVEIQTQKEISQKQIAKLEEKISANEKNDLIDVVDQWDSYVVSVECYFLSPTTGELLFQTNGSGLITKLNNSSLLVLTNKHIVTAFSLNSNQKADSCLVKFPQESKIFSSQNISIIDDTLDWGTIDLNLENNFFNIFLLNPPRLCTNNPNLGDSVAILGYPNIGDKNNVTVTEGIISGFDENYFITSAKVERGNSGGAAISIENNCYLGTPTFSTAGNIESLARILDVRVILER